MRLIESEFQVLAAPARGILVRSACQRRILTFLMVRSPGLNVMEADNDAGAVSTYMQAGGQYGLHMLWPLLVLLPIGYFIQEMVARLGIATGKAHAPMIYVRFGKRWKRFSFIALLVMNFLTLITEFASIPLALSALGISPSISVPVSAVGLTMLVVTGSYLWWERIVISLCLMDLICFVPAFMVDPHWVVVAHNPVAPIMRVGGITRSLLLLVIAIVATTSTPWQLFFQQSCVAERRLRFADLKWARPDTLIGAIVTVCVAGAMMLVGNYGFEHRMIFHDPARLALALGPIAGKFVCNGVLLLMVNAAVLGTTAISCNRMGVRRCTRLGALLAQEAVGSSGLLYNLHRLRWRGGGHRAHPPRATSTGDHQRSGLRRADFAGVHYLFFNYS